MKLAQISLIPLLVVALLLAGYLAVVNVQHAPATAQRVIPAVIAEGGSFDPNQFCRNLNQAFKLAGVPNLCTSVKLYASRPTLGSIQVYDGPKNVLQLDYGMDYAPQYQRFGLPNDPKLRVWQTNLNVFAEYQGRGIGQSVVQNYEMILKSVGARSGDIELLIASPSKLMTPQAQAAWETFISKICIAWNAVPIDSITPQVGCWRYLP